MTARPPGLDRLLNFVAANLPDAPAAEQPARTCLSCEHYLPAMAPEEPCNPDGCGCTGYPDACDIRAAPAGATFPIADCPAWQHAR